MAHAPFIHLHNHRWNCALLCGGGSSDRGGFCWHEALCQPNPSRSAYTPGGGGRQPGAALRIETQYMQMSTCMSATLAAPCDKVIYKQSAQTARRATWCIYRRGDAPLGMVVCTISRVFVLEKQDDGGQQFRCLRASLETLSLRGSGRGRHHSSPPGLLLQVRMTEDREMQSACVCRDSEAPPLSMCMNTKQPCALWDRQCALSFVSCRLQQSLVPQTRGTRGGEPIERHVGSYLSAFFRLLGESVCVACGRGREWETVECAAVRKSVCLCFIATCPFCRRRPGPGFPVD